MLEHKLLAAPLPHTVHTGQCLSPGQAQCLLLRGQIGLSSSSDCKQWWTGNSQEVKSLLGLLLQLISVDAPGQVLHDVDFQEAEVRDTFHTGPTYEQRLDVFFLPPEVHDELLGLWCGKEQVVSSAPLRQSLHLVSVVGLIPPRDEHHDRKTGYTTACTHTFVESTDRESTEPL